MGKSLSITKGTIVDTPDGKRGIVDSYHGAVGGMLAKVSFSGSTQEYKYKDLIPVPESDLPVRGDTVRVKGETEIVGKVHTVWKGDFWRYGVTRPNGVTGIYSSSLEKAPAETAESATLAGIRELIAQKESGLTKLHEDLAHLRLVEKMLVG